MACVPGAIEECPASQFCREVQSGGAREASCVTLTDAGVCDTGEPDEDAGSGCRPARGCGDGVRDSAVGEDCDDANREANDGCDSNCQVEQDWECIVPGQACRRIELGPPACRESICRQDELCVERASGLTCRCPEDATQEACPPLRVQSLDFPAGENRWWPRAISRDGSTVTGEVAAYKGPVYAVPHAALWSLGHRAQQLAVPAERPSSGLAISAGGEVTLVSQAPVEGATEPNGYVWRAGAIEPLPLPAGSMLVDISGDGASVAGTLDDRTGKLRAFRFSRADGLRDLGVFDVAMCSDEPLCEPRTTTSAAISDDGKVVVGNATGGAFRWSEAEGLRRLAAAAQGGEFSGASAVDTSADGAVILGWLDRPQQVPDRLAVRWVAGDRQSLGEPAQALRVRYNEPAAISGDGRVAVGTFTLEHESVAWVWDDAAGYRTLAAALSAPDTDLTGWLFARATGISGDGKLIVGSGSYRGQQVGFIARLP